MSKPEYFLHVLQCCAVAVYIQCCPVLQKLKENDLYIPILSP